MKFETYELDWIDANADYLDDINEFNEKYLTWKPWQQRAMAKIYLYAWNDLLYNFASADIVCRTPYLYANCDLTTVTLPDDCTTVGEAAFATNKDLETVELSKNLKVIGPTCFYNCGIKNIKLPETLEVIGARSFRCTEIDELEIPDAVSTIGAEAFSYCINLKQVKFSSNCTSISVGCFRGSAIEEIEIPVGVTHIDSYAFSDCQKLTKVTLPDGLYSVDDYAFINTGITVLELPQSIKYIGKCITGSWKMSSNGGYYGSMGKCKFKITGLKKDEARLYADKYMRFASLSLKEQFIKKLI